MKKLFIAIASLFSLNELSAQNEIIEFRIYRNECFSLLTWTTPKHVEELMFEVEKSYNNYDFFRVGEASYSGIYYQFKTHEYTDVDTTTAPTYYRLKLIKTNHEEITYTEKTLKVN